jgi:predicted glycoside hydrolase/deacetylase ChbG (UPF0249 family)
MGDNGENLFWWEEKTWSSSKGAKIIERISAGQVPDNFPRFVSVASITMKPPGMEKQVVNVVFDIEAEHIAEAMRKFDTVVKDREGELRQMAVEALQKKLNETHRQILVPRTGQK